MAQQADNCLSISHELNILRDINSDAHRRLEDAYETIRELSCNDDEVKFRRKSDLDSFDDGETLMITRKKCMESGIQVDDTSMIEVCFKKFLKIF